MDKIKSLLEKLGASDELSSEFIAALDSYKTSIRESLEAETAAKIAAAKKICLEETENYKRELARRVQIFCETKSAAIEASIAKQSAIRESEASAKLLEVRNLVEGVNGKLNGQSQAVVDQMKRMLQAANEEKAKAIETANRQTALAESVLKRNRALEAKLKVASINEDRSKRSQSRIDVSRKGGQARTTRATLLENQDNRPAPVRRGSTASSGENKFSINDIASSMETEI